MEKDADEEAIKKMNIFKDVLEKEAHQNSIDDNIYHLKRFNDNLSFYQRFKQSFERDLDVDPGRLLGLTDGIFGMVMTLLIFGLTLPEAGFLSSGDFFNFMMSLVPNVGITLVSFILLGSFWIYHHEFIKITNMNIPFMWLNIFYLACISFIPFSTFILGNYSDFFLSEVMFGVNVFLVVLTFFALFNYAYSKDFLEKKPSDIEIVYTYHSFFIIMLYTIGVILLEFFVSGVFIYLFLLIPIFSTLRDTHFRMIS